MSEEQTQADEQVNGGQDDTTPSFDPNATLPDADQLPNELKPYAGKTIGDVFKGYGELRRSYSKSQNQNKELQQKLQSVAPDGGDEGGDTPPAEPTQKQSQDDAAPQVPKDYVHKGEFGKAFNTAATEYFRNQGEISRETLDQTAKTTGMAERDILNILEYRKQQRQHISDQLSDRAEDLDINTLEDWLLSKDSPYTKTAANGMLEMMENGNIDWIPSEWQRMQKFIEGGQTFTGGVSGERFGNVKPVLRGDPGGGFAQKGFASREEMVKAREEAYEQWQKGKKEPLKQFEKKYAETPDKVKATF